MFYRACLLLNIHRRDVIHFSMWSISAEPWPVKMPEGRPVERTALAKLERGSYRIA
jgi:hypothetical protein